MISLIYDLVEVEALAITADEAVTALPPVPRSKYKRTMARLYTLIGKTAGRASAALSGARSWWRGPQDAQDRKRVSARRAR